jgi:hypothetical protein
MLYSVWHLGPHFRAFVELKSGLESSRSGGPRPIDEKKLDFQAAFFEARTSGKNWIAVRVGRQELNYRPGRPISVRKGPNVRQSFDGFKTLTTWPFGPETNCEVFMMVRFSQYGILIARVMISIHGIHAKVRNSAVLTTARQP